MRGKACSFVGSSSKLANQENEAFTVPVGWDVLNRHAQGHDLGCLVLEVHGLCRTIRL